MDNETKAEIARALFLSSTKTQKEIAAIVGWTQKSVNERKKKEGWDNFKKEKNLTRNQIISLLHNQMLQMMNAARMENRLLTVKEVDAVSKISSSIDRLSNRASIEQYIEVFEAFNKYLAGVAPEFLPTNNTHQDGFISKLINEGD